MIKSKILLAIGGLIIGIALTSLVAYKSAPGMMLTEAESKYNFEESVTKFRQTVLDMGWKIPVVHDMQEVMHTNGFQVNKMQVFELCHPGHAYRILQLDDERIVSSMMPCRVSIYEKSDGRTYISWMNTAMLGNMMGGVVADVMGEASAASYSMIGAIKK